MVTLHLDLAQHPVFSPIVSHCHAETDRMRNSSDLSVTKRPDFIAPFSHTLLSGLQMGELGRGILRKSLRKLGVTSYLQLMDSSDPYNRGHALDVLGRTFDSAYALGKDIYHARKIVDSPAIDTGSREVTRYFISMASEGLGLPVGDTDAFARHLERQYHTRGRRFTFH